MNILVTGACGQLGSELRNVILYGGNDKGNKYLFTDIVEGENVSKLDITSLEDIEDFVSKNHINVIVNCAAYTNVNKADTVEGFKGAKALNADALHYIANVAKKHDINVIHISTDYVFDGEKNTPYRETDLVNPQNVYGKTKYDGENFLMSIIPGKYIIIRTAWLYSPYGNNFVKTINKLVRKNEKFNVVIDQVGTPTYAKDLADAIVQIIRENKLDNPGVYHYSNEGVTSWYDFAQAIQQEIRCDRNDFITPSFTDKSNGAKRPCYSVLDKTKIKETFGISIPYWKTSLMDCLKRIYGMDVLSAYTKNEE